nr:hypothetical protein [Nostoc sp. EkiNYC01]
MNVDQVRRQDDKGVTVASARIPRIRVQAHGVACRVILPESTVAQDRLR